jgi:hypothetical protein
MNMNETYSKIVPGDLEDKQRLLDIIFSGELHIVHMDWGGGGGHISLRVVNVTWISLDSLAVILHFLNQFWISSRLVCNFCEAMAVSLSVATTALSSSKVAVVDSGEVGRSAVYCRYNNGSRTLPLSTPH